MKPPTKSTKYYEINQEKFKKCFVFYIGIFLCIYRPGISAGPKCGRPGRTATNNYEPSGNVFNENDKISYSCTQNNEVILGNDERRCLRNGSWSDDIPVCSKVASIERVELYTQNSENEDAYTYDGDVKTCSKASIENRTYWRGYLVTSINISAVRVSFIGVKEVDFDVLVQEESGSTKKCKLKAGEEDISIKSIKTLTFYCPAATTGRYIHVTCNNLSIAFCEIQILYPPSSSCLSPDIPLHGNGFKTYINRETIYTFECHAGYKRWNGWKVTCQPDGRYFPKSPVCEEIYCHPPEKIENGDVEFIENKGIIPYNGIATYSCKEGFNLSGKSVIRCQEWQTWDSSPPVCKAKVTENTDITKSYSQTDSWRQINVTHCGNLPQIANGVLIVNSTHVGSTAWLKCAEGFRPLTDDRIFCLPSGRWSLQSLHCKAVQCEEDPVIPYGKAILLNNSTYYGSYLEIRCDQGYGSQSTITRRCDENGFWGNLNICIEITCGAFKVEEVSHGQWLPVNGSTSLYVLICPEDFYIEGSPAVIRCLSNGSWSYTSAKCQKSFTSLWGSNWTPSLVLIAAVAAGVATAIVILCLSLAFLVLKKRRQAQTNTTVFHLENTSNKERISEIYPNQQKHHSAAENYNTVELRTKSVCTFPRKPRSALPNLPVDADPVYAQPFETTSTTKKTSLISINKKDDLYNTHIYAEPINSRRHTPTHILVNLDNQRIATDRGLSATRTNLENESMNSALTDQQNCDKKCAIYDSSGNSSLNSTRVTKDEKFQSYNGNSELGTLKKNLEYLELL